MSEQTFRNGRWVSACPYPMRYPFNVVRCQCRRWFVGLAAHEQHWRRYHDPDRSLDTRIRFPQSDLRRRGGQPMSDDRLDAIKARADKRHGPGWLSADDCKWLIAEVERLRVAAEKLRYVAERITDMDPDDGEGDCFWCCASLKRTVDCDGSHLPRCVFAAAAAALQEPQHG